MGTNKPEQFTLLLLFVEEGEARVDGGPLAQPGEVAGHEVRGGRGHVCVHWGGHRHQAVGHQVQVVLGVPAGGHEGPGLPQGERRRWILSGN